MTARQLEWNRYLRSNVAARALPGILLGLVALSVLGCARRPAATTEGVVAIEHVTVVDPLGNPAQLADRTVIVRGSRIESVAIASERAIPAGARRIDGRGRYLIPGLWDMHVHFHNAGRSALPLYVANGVTSVRDMGGFIDSIRTWQGAMQRGEIVGPTIYTPGGMLESERYLAGVRERSARLGGLLATRVLPYRVSVTDRGSAEHVLDSLAALRVDFVKYRTVSSPAALFDILREARRRSLRVAGHAPVVVSAAIAADSGQSDIEHALGITDTLVRRTTAERFRANGTFYSPTLVVTRAVTVPADDAIRQVFDTNVAVRVPGRRYMSQSLLDWWRLQLDERRGDTSAAVRRQTLRLYEESLLDVREFRAAGVRLLAGTDAGSTLIHPGFSLHDELEALVSAGLSPVEALRSATATPADFFGLSQTLGSVRPGAIADLVLLDANPLDAIANTRRIHAVMQRGRYLDRQSLDGLLDRVRAMVRR
jgi:imidazolonepropionase-like amidohydrolase